MIAVLRGRPEEPCRRAAAQPRRSRRAGLPRGTRRWSGGNRVGGQDGGRVGTGCRPAARQ